MWSELLSQLGSFEDHKPEDDYGLYELSAWTNHRKNYDWFIFRLKVDPSGMKVLQRPCKTIFIWTYFKTPFAIASQKQPVGCLVLVSCKLALGRGYSGYLVPTAYGGYVICEEHSGAIIGNSLNEVREDIRSGNVEVMRRQIIDARKESEIAKVIAPEEFWSEYYESANA